MGKASFALDLLELRLLDASPKAVAGLTPIGISVLGPDGGSFSFHPARLPRFTRGDVTEPSLRLVIDEDLLFSLLTEPTPRWSPSQVFHYEGRLEALYDILALTSQPAPTRKAYHR